MYDKQTAEEINQAVKEVCDIRDRLSLEARDAFFMILRGMCTHEESWGPVVSVTEDDDG